MKMDWTEVRKIYDNASHAYQLAYDQYILACQTYPDLYDAVLSAESNVDAAQEALDSDDTLENQENLLRAKQLHEDALVQMNAVVPEAHHHKVETQLKFIRTRKAYIDARYHLH